MGCGFWLHLAKRHEMNTSMRSWNTNTVTSTTSTTGISMSVRCLSRILTGIAMSRFAISTHTIRTCIIGIGTGEHTLPFMSDAGGGLAFDILGGLHTVASAPDPEARP